MICDSRVGVLSNASSLLRLTDWVSPRTITFGVGVAACKIVVPAARGHLVHKDLEQSVRPKKKRMLCTESRKVNCRGLLMAVTEMRDCGFFLDKTKISVLLREQVDGISR